MKGLYLNALQELLQPGIARRGNSELKVRVSGQRVKLWCHASDLDVLIVKLDDIPGAGLAQQNRLFPLLNPTQADATRCCDCMPFCQRDPERGGDLFVLLAELKQGGAGAGSQLRNGCLLARWLLSVASLHRPEVPQPARVFFRGLVFSARKDRPKPNTGRSLIRYPEPDAFIPGLRVVHLPDKTDTGFAIEPFLNDCGDAPWLLGP